MSNETNTSDAYIEKQKSEIAAAKKSLDGTIKSTVQKDVEKDGGWWSVQDAMTISSAVLIFGAVVITIAATTSPKDSSLDSKLRLFGTIMVLTLVGFVVVAGYDDQQIAAPLGLLGTIAGYLLGKADRDNSKEPPAR